MKTTFSTHLSGFGNNTGIEVPERNIIELAAGKKPPVVVNVNGFVYRSTVGIMGGKYLISFPKANREATGLQAGDLIEVELDLEEGVREVEVPPELEKALRGAGLQDAFKGLSYSSRKEYSRQVRDAKNSDTKERRIEKVVKELQY